MVDDISFLHDLLSLSLIGEDVSTVSELFA